MGVTVTFLPQYQLGADGMPRRYADYPANPGWGDLNLISTVGSWIMALAVLVFVVNVVLTLRRPPDAPDDPWRANSLEWATSSPPPKHNFTSLPVVRSERPVFDARHSGRDRASGRGDA